MKCIKMLACLFIGIISLEACSKKDVNENTAPQSTNTKENTSGDNKGGDNKGGDNKGGDNKGETNISARNTSRSHHMGENCMGCHKSGGKGEGWFNIAGTVYDEKKQNTYPNAVIKLYTGKNATGDLKYTIEGDLNGNFFTTANIDFSSPLYATVEGSNGKQHMQTSIPNGQCNSCHTQNNRIWTN